MRSTKKFGQETSSVHNVSHVDLHDRGCTKLDPRLGKTEAVEENMACLFDEVGEEEILCNQKDRQDYGDE